MFKWLKTLFGAGEVEQTVETVVTPEPVKVKEVKAEPAAEVKPKAKPGPKPKAKVEKVVEVDTATVKVTKSSLAKLTKQGLEDFAKQTYGVDLDKRKKKEDLVKEVLALSKKS